MFRHDGVRFGGFFLLLCSMAGPGWAQHAPPADAKPPTKQFEEAPGLSVLLDDVPKSPKAQLEMGIGKSMPDPAAKNPAHPEAELRRALEAAGVAIDTMEPVVPSLDDVFLDVVDRA